MFFKICFWTIGFHLSMLSQASTALSYEPLSFLKGETRQSIIHTKLSYLVITVLAIYIAIRQYCNIVFIQWCIGMRNCADVLQMTTTLPPRSRRQSCPRRSMFEVHLRLKGLSVFFICFPFNHRPTLLHWPAMCFVLRLPKGIVHLDA